MNIVISRGGERSELTIQSLREWGRERIKKERKEGKKQKDKQTEKFDFYCFNQKMVRK